MTDADVQRSLDAKGESRSSRLRARLYDQLMREWRPDEWEDLRPKTTAETIPGLRLEAAAGLLLACGRDLMPGEDTNRVLRFYNRLRATAGQ